MKIIHRILAGLLIAVILTPSLTTITLAAEPPVSTDETLYANLDYYGKVGKINIVKGCTLNGNSEFKDYGAYTSVTNMSNTVVPSLSADGVSWKLPEGTAAGQHFYYECTPKSKQIILPWDLDVSYKLNGVPADVKKLAGASGTVEINVKAMPNKNASDYFKNNMLLAVGVYVDTENNLSVDAPGSQLISIGGKKIVMFAGIPGEETTFTVRIGSEKFETSGIIIMMTPGTLEQMKDIKDLKEKKNTVEDSLNAITESTNLSLSTIESMSSGLTQVQSGLMSMDKARNTFNSSEDGLYDDADKALADLAAVSDQTAKLIPHLESAQTMVKDMNTDINNLVGTISDTKTNISSLGSSIEKIQDNLSDLRDVMDDIEDNSSDRNDLIKTLRTEITGAKTGMTAMVTSLDSMETSLNNLSADMGSLQPTLDSLADSGDPNATLLAYMLPSLKDVIDSSSGLISILEGLSGESDNYLNTAYDAVNLADSYFDALDEGADTADELLKNSDEITETTQSLLGSGETLIDNIVALNNTINTYQDEAVNTLEDTADLMSRITNALNSSKAFLSSFESTLKSSRGNLDEGTRNSLNGLIDVLKKGLDGISQASVIKNATNTIKKTIDEEINKYENENNLLNLDAEAKPISFTSSKNPAPHSIQVIMRTEEISVNNIDNTKDSETAKQDVGPFERIRNVFVEIWNAIISAFSK